MLPAAKYLGRSLQRLNVLHPNIQLMYAQSNYTWGFLLGIAFASICTMIRLIPSQLAGGIHRQPWIGSRTTENGGGYHHKVRDSNGTKYQLAERSLSSKAADTCVLIKHGL